MYIFIYFWQCCVFIAVWAFFFFLIAVNVCYSLVEIHELLIAVASLAAEHGL